MENKRPTFGRSKNNASSMKKTNRPEIGAIWEKNTKTNRTYFNIKLDLPKEKLQQLVANCSGEIVRLNLIAFPNDYKQENDDRPSFRIYEELKKS